MGIKIIIGGDFCITPPYISSSLFSGELVQLFDQSDLNIVNLECPVIEEGNEDKIVKSGPHLHTNKDVFKLLKQLNIHAVTLANNHILDYGHKGLMTTIEACRENNITITGAGENIEAAAKPTIIEVSGLKIALVNFCESEFSIATRNSGGANPLDVIDNLGKIKFARTIADFVLVIIHGGHEHYNFPSPRMLKQYRFFADNGADAVIGHHTHCISGYEIHNEVPIFYGLGNMVFTEQCTEKGWYNGLLLQLEIQKGSAIQWNLIPITQSKKTFQLGLPDHSENEKIIDEISYYSSIISDREKLDLKWTEYVQKKESQYLNVFSPINSVPGRYIRAILRRLNLNNILFRKKFVIPILNCIECEAHYDLSKAIFNMRSKK